jgi:GT2 family glycosyltransferase
VIIGVNGVAGHAFAGLPRCSAGYFGRAALSHEYSAVTSACMAMRRAVFEAVGGFDEQTFPVNFNDIDLCLRVRGVGLKVLYCAQAELVHHESASRRNAAHVEDRIALESDRFRQRWMEVIREDPFYSPNLSLEDGRTFALAVPPRTRDPWAETGLARPPSRTDPYASLDNWTRAVEVETAQRLFTIPDRTWQPGLSIVILTLERFELIAPLLDQLVGARGPLAERGLDLQIVVGDTGSKDERVLRKYADLARQVEVEGSLRYHFSRCNNWLFRQRVIMDKTLFLNNDIVFSDPTASLLALARPLQTQSDIGIVGAALSYPDGRVQHSGIDFYRSGPTRGLPFHPHHGAPAEELSALAEGRDCPAVTGACLAIRSSLFLEMGGFDEAYRTEGQDVALCLEAWRHGHRCHLVPAGRIDHLENGTRPKGSEDWMDRQRLLRRWRAFVETGLC